jgi:hypothetical protein
METEQKIVCPYCKEVLDNDFLCESAENIVRSFSNKVIGSKLGSIKTPKKSKASVENGKKGGRPRKNAADGEDKKR